jgi:hypothetical protein
MFIERSAKSPQEDSKIMLGFLHFNGEGELRTVVVRNSTRQTGNWSIFDDNKEI